MKFRVRYARAVYLETIVDAESVEDVRDDGKLPSVYTNIPTEMIPSAVNSVEDYEGCWEVTPAWDEMPEELLNRLSAAEKLTAAAEIFEPHWEDDYVTAAAAKGDPSYSILDFARDVVVEALRGISADDYQLEGVVDLLSDSADALPES